MGHTVLDTIHIKYRIKQMTHRFTPEITWSFLISVNLELINYLWIPNIFIYNLKTFQTIEVLSKLAGLWIDAQKRIYYSQATHITFICEYQDYQRSCLD